MKNLNEMKTMEDILTVLEEATSGMNNSEKLSDAKEEEIIHKSQLRDEIKQGFITDVEKAKKWFELIELIYTWALDDKFEYNIAHVLIFDEGELRIYTSHEGYQEDVDVDFVNGQLLLDGETLEEYDFLGGDKEGSINVLMNVLEFRIMAHDEF
ncbi:MULTISPECIES: hypothetical protein [Bacillus]|uniref:hypothetical protein n=1 Tax=Bacillus TaxID=1386 RepID=UPI00077AEFCA|nr:MULTISPECIES: hypothetical protein [Bacillus cereus group]KXY76757.1 hypothetical protein AT270_10710 [Bacillus cereus]MBG9938509.1 hypothetical protein [Bacillus tropicus]MED2995305.1 hypothetical protein [Bacillus tropicus]OTY52051.1 hypothetical protein BK748_21130 [Bacillus thuringiensis serovar graciosensis]